VPGRASGIKWWRWQRLGHQLVRMGWQREIVEKDCEAQKLNREDAMDRIRCMKQIRDD